MNGMENNVGYRSEISPINKLVSGSWYANQGLVIPDYQRNYTWEQNQIERFFLDILSGLSALQDKYKNPGTFLGATVWCKRKRKVESDFPGTSHDIVDGQQRITTCVLLGIVLYIELKTKTNDLNSLDLPLDIKEWLKSENDSITEQINTLIFGEVGASFKKHPFPRIINEEDVRATSEQASEYKSPISLLIKQFLKQIFDEKFDYSFIDKIKINENEKDVFNRIKSNINKLKDFIHQIFGKNFFVEKNIKFITHNKLTTSRLKNLFIEKYPESNFHTLLNENKKFEHFIRLTQFTNYFLNYTFFTLIICEDENQAFSIFDSLNTTGVPLTAIETLKPYVMRLYMNRKETFKGSDSDKNFDLIKNIVRFHDLTLDQQISMSKEAVVYAALLGQGEVKGYNLTDQRNYLRYLQDTCEKNENVDLPSEIIWKVLNYKNEFFPIDKIRNLHDHNLNEQKREEIKFVSALFSSSGTTLAIPILSRFYWDGEIKQNFELYHKACLALAAFYILRRSTTTTTASIDNVFRELLCFKINDKDAFNISAKKPSLLDDEHLKKLKEFLMKHISSKEFEFNINRKDEWVEKVMDMPLYTSNAKTLLKIMLIIAHDGTGIDTENNALITRKNIVENTSRNFINFSIWDNVLYKSLEHIAPQTPNTGEWDNKIYEDARLHTIGNFVLLPVKQNKSLSNSKWEVKRLFLNVLLSNTIDGRNEIIEKGHDKGTELPPGIQNIILSTSGPYSLIKAEMLSGLDNVELWNADYIKLRSERLTALVWDRVIQWIK